MLYIKVLVFSCDGITVAFTAVYLSTWWGLYWFTVSRHKQMPSVLQSSVIDAHNDAWFVLMNEWLGSTAVSGSFTQWIIFKQSHVFLSCTSFNTVSLSLSHTPSVSGQWMKLMLTLSNTVGQWISMMSSLLIFTLTVFSSLSLSLSFWRKQSLGLLLSRQCPQAKCCLSGVLRL